MKLSVCIDVPDLERGVAFYGPVFGFTEMSRPIPTLAVIDAGGVCEQRYAAEKGRPPVAFCSDPFGNGFCLIGPR